LNKSRTAGEIIENAKKVEIDQQLKNTAENCKISEVIDFMTKLFTCNTELLSMEETSLKNKIKKTFQNLEKSTIPEMKMFETALKSYLICALLLVRDTNKTNSANLKFSYEQIYLLSKNSHPKTGIDFGFLKNLHFRMKDKNINV
jgi:hypothetical protein